MTERLEFAAGIGLDLAIGDPPWLPHPVRAVGWLAQKLEAVWRGSGLPLRSAGIFFWVTVVGLSGGCAWLTILFIPRPFPQIYWIFALIAIRDLDFEAVRVIRALEGGDLDQARHWLSWIVGRDTAHLDGTEIYRATIETVAENFSDAVVAPLFYLALAGPVGMMAYKAANTLDSMVGYRNDTYRDFGWASARLDDLLNYLPARLSLGLICLAAALSGMRAGASVRIGRRDGASQPSPNSGYPEAAFAGALGVRLGGENFYQGRRSLKNFMGDALRPLDAKSFRDTRILYYGSAAIATVCAGLALR